MNSSTIYINILIIHNIISNPENPPSVSLSAWGQDNLLFILNKCPTIFSIVLVRFLGDLDHQIGHDVDPLGINVNTL
jgi:hypothetical protein